MISARHPVMTLSVTLALLHGLTVAAPAQDRSSGRTPGFTTPESADAADQSGASAAPESPVPERLTALLIDGERSTAGRSFAQACRELSNYAVLFQREGIPYREIDSEDSDSTSLLNALTHANIIVYCGPGDPMRGGWRLGSLSLFQQASHQIRLSPGTIVIQHTLGPLGFFGIHSNLAHYRAALFAGHFLLSGASAYFEVGSLSGVDFLQALCEGASLGRAFQSLPAHRRAIIAERHPMLVRSSLLMHPAGRCHNSGYDSILAGRPEQTLRSLFAGIAAPVAPISEPIPGDQASMPPAPDAPLTPPPSDHVSLATSPSVPAYIARGQYIASMALSYRGHRYVWGGTQPSGFDCSGLVQYICAKSGLRVPRLATPQYATGTPITHDRLQPGDLVFFKNTYKRGLSHVGIYIGDGYFVQAAGRAVGVIVSVLDISNPNHWAGARRLNLWKLPRIAGEPGNPKTVRQPHPRGGKFRTVRS